jgi:hypothetical protein
VLSTDISQFINKFYSVTAAFGSTAKLTTSRLYLSQPQRNSWREPSSQYGANCPVSYTALSSSPGTSISNSSSGVQASYQNMALRASHCMHRFYSGRASTLYVVSQNGYANYASVISFRSLAIIHLLYHRLGTYKTRIAFVGYTFIAHVLMHHCKSCMCINQEHAFTRIVYRYWLTRVAIHWILAGLHDSTSIITCKPSQFSITSARRIIKST